MKKSGRWLLPRNGSLWMNTSPGSIVSTGKRSVSPAKLNGIVGRWMGMSAEPCATTSPVGRSSAHERSPASFHRFEYAVRRTTFFISSAAVSSPFLITSRVMRSIEVLTGVPVCVIVPIRS